MPITIESLPSEIIGSILRHVIWPTDLLASSLVCRRWRSEAQRVLYSSVTLDLLTSEKGLGWIKSPGRDAASVVSMSLTTWGTDEDASTIEEVLVSCGDSLRRLELQEKYSEEEDDPDYRPAGGPGGADWSVLCLPNLSGLKSLSLYYPEHFVDPHANNATSGVLPLPFRLSHLFLFLDGDATNPHNLIKSLLEISAESLTYLQLDLSRRYTSRVLDIPSFAAVAARLTRLSITFRVKEKGAERIIARLMTSLQELELDFMWSQHDLNPHHAFECLDAFIRALPSSPTVSHLSLRHSFSAHTNALPPALQPPTSTQTQPRGPTSLAQNFMGTMVAPSLASLQHLSFRESNAESVLAMMGEEGYAALQTECHARAIQVRFCEAFL